MKGILLIGIWAIYRIYHGVLYLHFRKVPDFVRTQAILLNCIALQKALNLYFYKIK